MKLSVFWFRRDLRLEDNTALIHALNSGFPVMPVFIFDDNILDDLPEDDARVNFIYETLAAINKQLNIWKSSIKIFKGKPEQVWKGILSEHSIAQVFINKDYEPYAIERERNICELLKKHDIQFHAYKDQVVFEEDEIVKNDGSPYTVFTPYKNKWLARFNGKSMGIDKPPEIKNFHRFNHPFPSLSELGFRKSDIKPENYNLSQLTRYASTRNFPDEESTSYLGPHLRFGTISIREVIGQLKPDDEVFLGELIWREFFMQILFHFPKVVYGNFHSKYNGIAWRNDEGEFQRWCNGNTGYPLVDAGMRQLNQTGFMHNRVRMVTASFLCKHLLVDWKWGEAYFAGKLLDYELASNNGNWQWAAGTGCDAAPYFRIFNPTEQLKKFDRAMKYVKRWVPEFDTPHYPPPMVDHKFARQRAIEAYRKGLK
jgi:deoxyribodipyrimidine photo-lyase